MKTIRITETGGPEVLRLVELPTPAPGPGQLLVRVEAAGVNFIDIYWRSGQYQNPLPLALGLEGAGVVEAIGEGVLDVAIGARVAWAAAPGSYATHVLVDVAKAVAVPDGVSSRVAAAAMLQGMTAHYLARSTFALGPSHACVVHAAAGGVGLLLCQLARRAGAKTIGLVSTDEKAARAKAAGADHVLVGVPAFASRVRELARSDGDEGAHVVYDSVGRATFRESLASLRARGLCALFGQSSGAVEPFDPQELSRGGSLFLTRPTLGHYTRTRAELVARAGDVLGAIARNELAITIDSTFPLAEARAAHEKLASRATIGKVLLEP